jgi:methenyltetrahydrofolate cyclohydrolase
LIDQDSEAYRSVMAAFRLPKASDADKAARADAIQAGMRAATDVPMDTMRACQQALSGAVIVARNVARVAASDVGMAIELLAAALRGSGLGIDSNLGSIKDEAYVTRVAVERTQLDSDGAADAAQALALLRS